MRKRYVILAGLVTTLAAAGLVVIPSAGHSGQAMAQLLAAASDPMAILDGRSPGARRAGVVQTKPAAAPAQRPQPHAVPHERVLSEVRQRPVAPAASEVSPLADAQDLIDSVLPPTDTAPPEIALAHLPQPPVGPVPPVIIPSGGGSSGGGSSGGTEPMPPPPALPEPSTWFSMIIGMGLIGGLLRRSNRARPTSRPGATTDAAAGPWQG